MMEALSRLAPDLWQQIGTRSLVLERIGALQPIGRRALAGRLNLPEREVRAQASALREAGFVELDAAGMTLTQAAQEVLPVAREISHGIRALSMLEASLSRLLGVPRVVITPGDADEDAFVTTEVGIAAAQRLRGLLRDGSILAVTGGTTIAQVARNLPVCAPMDVLVVPARGGNGRAVETQAGTLAALIAQRLGGHNRLLHIPDRVDGDALQAVLALPEVREVLELIDRADVLLHGVGRADDLAHYRRLTQAEAEEMFARGGVAEAYGYFFDAQGRIVYAGANIGVSRESLARIRTMVAVAAGSSKAEAIIAVLRGHRHELLVTDEGAARQMLALLKE